MKKNSKMTIVFLSLVLLMTALQVTGFASLTNLDSYDSEYTSSIVHSEKYKTGDELVLVKFDDKGNSKRSRKELYADSTPNTITNIKTVPTKGLTTLDITTDYFGVVIEPTDKPDFVIDLHGVKYQNQVNVTTSVKSGTLSVDIKGDDSTNKLLSTVENNRINVVRIGVPSSMLGKIQITDNRTSCILVNKLNNPVNIKVSSGTARVQGDVLKGAISMEGASGDLIVIGNKVEGQLTMKVTSGDIDLEAKSVTGKTALTATSGDIDVDAGSITNAVFAATIGDIDANVGAIVESLSAKISSGDLDLDLLKKPVNLTFYLDDNANNGDVSLPRGWKNGYSVGNGKPILRLGVTSGDVELNIGY